MARLRDEGLEAVGLDLDDSASIREALAQTLCLTDGRLFALFNNGAYGQPGAVEDLSRDVLRAQLETNLLGWHELTCRIIPLMRKQGEGRIIQNSSILGFTALPDELVFQGHSVLFRNKGDGTFEDVTKESGLYREEVKWASGCTWLDYDKDATWDEKKELWKLSGKIVKTTNCTQSAIGTGGMWTCTVAAAVLIM